MKGCVTWLCKRLGEKFTGDICRRNREEDAQLEGRDPKGVGEMKELGINCIRQLEKNSLGVKNSQTGQPDPDDLHSDEPKKRSAVRKQHTYITN